MFQVGCKQCENANSEKTIGGRKPQAEGSRRRKGAVGGRELSAEGSLGTVRSEVVKRARSFQQNLLNIPVGPRETFLQTFLNDHVKQQFSVPIFCGSVSKSWRESPNY